MASGDAGQCRLTPRALADLEDIWLFSAEAWPISQADRYVDDLVRVFELIATMPTMAREHRELSPPVRIHVHESHLVIYRIADDHVSIIRLLGGRQDWASILKAADL
ncbi:type II toxin-antitoxin system RelE/ParE family toxin [Methylosinus sp. Sm6]|uniref:type II toxin-antitoxin system RelE/ParE family toxin n=1 Tax=Methylosinus sp. Sm6 TaxID=2866948 RepID=UPI001C995FFE|nr:type II toxin-antitoxin system RelE/ParE family toxin [Methylosinus sp. Sm6]MBY6243895.1 type II toxin-antitoxin system RelE/ParE family toxin [Methylosinus sp. Sm6]